MSEHRECTCGFQGLPTDDDVARAILGHSATTEADALRAAADALRTYFGDDDPAYVLTDQWLRDRADRIEGLS